LPKRGYRFIKSVDSIGTDAQESVAPRTVLPSSDHRLGERLPFKLLISIAVGMFVALLTVLVGVRERRQNIVGARIRQLTTNSTEVPVRTAAISPDGKLLAFSDITGLHIKNTETSETGTLPVPHAAASGRVDWQIMGWFPDGGSFLANIAPFEDICLH